MGIPGVYMLRSAVEHVEVTVEQTCRTNVPDLCMCHVRSRDSLEKVIQWGFRNQQVTMIPKTPKPPKPEMLARA